MTILILMMTASILFMKISHPLSMGKILLIQTLLIPMWFGTLSINFWYSYIFFIIMVGGMLILFIYMTSVPSNEKFSLNKFWLILIFPLIMIYMFKDKLFGNMNSMNMDISTNKFFFTMSLNKFLMYPMMYMSMTIIIYLLITLIAVSKITNIIKGPLRKNI
nr:NADH dehydrogenase subunit 6 [Aquatica wuhana]